MSNVQEPFEAESRVPAHRPHRHPPSFFWPLVLIGAGVLLLLSNLGYLPWQSWNLLWRLWPLLLVALGIDILIGRRSMIGAIVSGLLILALIGGAVGVVLFAQNIPALANLTPSVELHTEHVEHPLENVEQASVIVDWTSAPSYLSALRDSPNLIEADVTYRGDLIFDVDVRGERADVELDSHFSGPWFGPYDFGGQAEKRWDVRLSPDVLLDLTLDAGSGSCDFDLSDLQVSDLFLDSGSGSVDLALPTASTFEARIDSGSGSITIILPESVGARVVLDSGSGSFHPDERFRLVEGRRNDDGTWETGNFDTAEHSVVLFLDQGSGSISIR
jgi:hypothetical protein